MEPAPIVVYLRKHLDGVTFDEGLVHLDTLLELAWMGAAARVAVDFNETHGDSNKVEVGGLIGLN